MRVHVFAALTALSIVGAVPLGDTSRSISDWLWPLAVDTYPEVQPAASAPERSAVEPIVNQLQEEGRRRSDEPKRQKRIDKDVQVAISISKGKGGGGGGGGGVGGGHNTPVKPVAGAPIYGPGGSGYGPVYGSSGSSPGTVAVVVDEADSSWGWGWIKGMMGSSWAPSWGWGSGSAIGSSKPGAILVPSKGVLGSGGATPGKGSGYGVSSAGGHGGGGGSPGGDQHGDSDILSVSYGLAPADHYDTHGPGMFNPFSGWWYPSSSAVSGPSYGSDDDHHHSQTMSEVMVIRYPEFIKTIGKGISKMTNAMKDLGKGVSDTFMKGITDTSAGIGSGVAAIIPLEEVADPQHDVGGQNFKPGPQGIGHGPGFKPNGGYPSKGSGHGDGSGPHGGASVVYVDKHTIPAHNNYVKGSLFGNPSSWFGAAPSKGSVPISGPGSGSGYLPGMSSALGSLFGSGSDSGQGGYGHGHGASGLGPDSTSTVYVEKPKGGHHHG